MNEKTQDESSAAAERLEETMSQEKSEPTEHTTADTTTDSKSATMGDDSQAQPKKKRKRRPPLVPWKKPKDMPRRPLSAYNIFFREQREKMMSQVAKREAMLPEADVDIATTDGKKKGKKRGHKSVGIGFANLARTIASNWKDLDEAARAPYESVAQREKGSYNEKMLVWRAKQKKLKEDAAMEGSTLRNDRLQDAAEAEPLTSRIMADTTAGSHTVDGDSMPIGRPSMFTTSQQQHQVPTMQQRALDSNLSPIQMQANSSSTRNWSDSNQQFLHQASTTSVYRQGQQLHASSSLSMGNNRPVAMAMGQWPYSPGGSVAFQGSNSERRAQFQEQMLRESLPFNPTQQPNAPGFQRFGGTDERWNAAYHSEGGCSMPMNAAVNRPSGPAIAPTFPNTWFEVDQQSPASRQHTKPQQAQVPGSKLYPDTWFEVGNERPRRNDLSGASNAEAMDDEPIRYSPEGDLMGKLPGNTLKKNSPSAPSRPIKWTTPGGESKIGDTDYLPVRSLEEMASVGRQQMRQRPTKQQQSGDPMTGALGVQFDSDTIDFLKELRHDAGTSESGSSDTVC